MRFAQSVVGVFALMGVAACFGFENQVSAQEYQVLYPPVPVYSAAAPVYVAPAPVAYVPYAYPAPVIVNRPVVPVAPVTYVAPAPAPVVVPAPVGVTQTVRYAPHRSVVRTRTYAPLWPFPVSASRTVVRQTPYGVAYRTWGY
ncbi:hypothetical protein AB1L42_21055 [Thalassoglobus sp. JC818]|uniref:hypothetical protein n=1 Tax=Thalassoglobus sp. JC818 TaxID=3232136 RepID=UPI00345ABF89